MKRTTTALLIISVLFIAYIARSVYVIGELSEQVSIQEARARSFRALIEKQDDLINLLYKNQKSH